MPRHELIRKAWAADEPFVFNGRFAQLRYANCWPKPVQKPRPPIFIPGGGSVETYDFCIENDYNYSVHNSSWCFLGEEWRAPKAGEDFAAA